MNVANHIEMQEKVAQNCTLHSAGWVGKPRFQTACRFVGFTTQPTRCITFLCISLYVGFANPTYAGDFLLPLFRMLEVVDLRDGLDQIAVVGTGFIERAGGRMQQLVGELHG